MFFWRVHESQNQLFLTMNTPNDSKYFKDKSQFIFDKYLFGNLKILKLHGPKSPEDPSNVFENAECLINFFKTPWDGHSWNSWILDQYLQEMWVGISWKSQIWDQSLQENMEWKFGKMGSIQKHGKELCYFQRQELKPLKHVFSFNERKDICIWRNWHILILCSFQLQESPHPSTFQVHV